MKNVMDEIEASLNDMEKSGKADGVLKSVGKLRESLAALKSRWLDEPDTDAFYFYHAVYSTEMILDRMDERFKAAQAGDNPKIAEDSLAVTGPMRDLLNAAGADHISETTIDAVLESTRSLLTAAYDADLRENIEKNWAVIDKDLLKSKYPELMKKIKCACNARR